MNQRVSDERNADRIVLWLACLFAACAGVYLVFFSLEGAIDRQTDSSARVGSIASADQRLFAQRPELEQSEHRYAAIIRRFNLDADHSTSVARFIHESAQLAARHRVILLQIDERPLLIGDPEGQHRSANPVDFEDIPLDVTLSGSYSELLATIRDLAQAPVALHLEIAAIERGAATDRALTDASLTARLRISIERRLPAPPSPSTAISSEEATHARSI